MQLLPSAVSSEFCSCCCCCYWNCSSLNIIIIFLFLGHFLIFAAAPKSRPTLLPLALVAGKGNAAAAAVGAARQQLVPHLLLCTPLHSAMW